MGFGFVQCICPLFHFFGGFGAFPFYYVEKEIDFFSGDCEKFLAFVDPDVSEEDVHCLLVQPMHMMHIYQ